MMPGCSRPILAAGLFLAGALGAVELPPLTIHTVGDYGRCPWEGRDPSSPPPEPASRAWRVRDLNFCIRNIWVRDQNALDQMDLTEIRKDIEAGWKFNPPRTMLLRIDFWGPGGPSNSGAERYELPVQPAAVYQERMAAVLGQLEPVLDKLQGVSLSEENSPEGARQQVLQEVYDFCKRKYPNVRFFQWWTPDTCIPRRQEGKLLSADGWVVDPYGLTPARYPKGPTVKRLVQKYLVTGVPLIFTLNASTEMGLRPLFPEVMRQQLEVCTDFNLPTVFYWTYQKDETHSSTVFFGHPTGDELMDRVNARVFEWIKSTQSLPKDFTGRTEEADTWENPPLRIGVHRGLALYQEDFSESRFLDNSSGAGFRDLVWNGAQLRARGFQGRKVVARLIYKLASDKSMDAPQVSLQTETDPKLDGAVHVYLSSNGGRNWPVKARTPQSGGRQMLVVPTRSHEDFKAVKELWVRIELRGRAGTVEKPPVQIDDLVIHTPDTPPGAAAITQNFLDVDFEDGYREGPVADQSGGVVGGPWKAGPGVFDVRSRIAPLAGKALTISRQDRGSATVLFTDAMDIATPHIYFAADIYRPDDQGQGLWTICNSKSGANTGLGFSLGPGVRPVLKYITATQYRTSDSSFVIENQKWHRIEIEANGLTRRYNLYVQVEGKPGRTTVAENVSWEVHNRMVDEWLIYPGGGAESMLLTDNLAVWSVSGFPVNRLLPK